DEKVEEICRNCPEIVVPANYNSPEQLVISGTLSGIEWATEQIKTAGARRVMQLAVGGAFHSPLMQTAKDELAKAIDETHFAKPLCPIYQNVTADASTDIATIRENLKWQLTHPIRWTQTIRNMVTDGATEFVEFGPGDVLQGLIRKITPDVEVRHG
ncbi:MAG TPA: ACP S-malonyltransferase, partial [Bacteroidales bacterium]|nr:ACP S-malonyltransferase [Bacteroidales bacterium]